MPSTTIYKLIDPRDDTVRYIGKSVNPRMRMYQHLALKGRSQKDRWIRELHDLGLKPQIECIETVHRDEAATRERQWIEYGLNQGWPLTNSTNGGEGCFDPAPRISVPLSPETAIKLRMIAMNQCADPREVASQLLSEKVDEEVDSDLDIMNGKYNGHNNDDNGQEEQPQ